MYCLLFFGAVFDWVFSKILDPVFNFVAGLLSPVISWVFDTVLAPIIQAVARPVIEYVLQKVLMPFLGMVLYFMLCRILVIIDTIEKAFNILIGIDMVSYKGASMPLIDVVYRSPNIVRAFLMVTIFSIALAAAFALFGILRSTLDFDFENKKPVGHVLRNLFKTMVNFIVVPITVWLMISLSGIILTGVSSAITKAYGKEGTPSLGAIIFIISTLEAIDSDNAASLASIPIDDTKSIWYKYYTGKTHYTNVVSVAEDFDFGKIDYIMAFAGAIFTLVIMAICLVVFVQRIFEVMTLFIMAPLFVAPMPIDEGEKFRKWRELFIGKVFMGFGSIFAMRLYLMILPTVMSSSVKFESIEDPLSNYGLKFMFLLGGMFAVLKSSSLLTSLLSSTAGSQEQASLSATGGFVGGLALAGTGSAMSSIMGENFLSKKITRQGLSQTGLSGIKDEYDAGKKEKENEFKKASQAFTGKKEGQDSNQDKGSDTDNRPKIYPGQMYTGFRGGRSSFNNNYSIRGLSYIPEPLLLPEPIVLDAPTKVSDKKPVEKIKFDKPPAGPIKFDKPPAGPIKFDKPPAGPIKFDKPPAGPESSDDHKE